ncbi:zinc-finger associated domain containing protein, partial [Oryctes borbonicus]
MSGYKRVNFYELCRLCASNQQKEKTHIFQEEGRKIQLQNKIQSCLSLKVCENDFLPKVVCSQCLRTLEECYTFRNECVSSETMLSSYFNNFRYTEDFKKSGKVYIKDTTTTKTQQKELTQKQTQHFEFIAIPNGNNISNSTEDNEVAYIQSQNDKPLKNDSKPLAYNLGTINFAALKGIVQNIPKNEQINNISVSSNGEIINITPLIDLESIFVQNQLQKPLAKQICKSNKKLKPEKHEPE